MKTTAVLAAGALAGLASAIPHVRRDEIWITDTVYVTDVITVYAGEPTPTAAAISSSSTVAPYSAIHSAHSKLHGSHRSSAQKSTSSSVATPAMPVKPSGLPESASRPLTGYTPTAATSSAVPHTTSSKAASSSASALPTLSGGGYTYSAPAGTASSSAPRPSVSTGLKGYTGIKAGLSGYIGCQSESGFSELAPHIGWYSDYSPTTPDWKGVQGIPMLWGNGIDCSSVSADRLSEFQNLTAHTTPKIMFGFYEPDCDCTMSSQISSASDGLKYWNQYLKPLQEKGVTMGSPSMCTQKDETWLQEFSNVKNVASSSQWKANWDVTSIHINKNSIEGVKEDIEYYASTYKKPIWVSEFACVDDKNGFTPCTDQGQINNFINAAVSYFQKNASVVAYGPSNGAGLGDVWPLFKSDGSLSASGQTYFNAIKSL